MEVRPVFNSFIPKLLKVNAITLYPYILFSEAEPSQSTMDHEMVHVGQIQKIGRFKFYLSYLLFYCALRLMGQDHQKAYYNIAYEKEAYGDDHFLNNNH
jgi:hypothetical protein